MRSCYEVLNLVITLKSISIGKEFVDIIHATKSHVATEFGDAYGVFAAVSDHFLSLNFEAHGCYIFYEALYEICDVLGCLFR